MYQAHRYYDKLERCSGKYHWCVRTLRIYIKNSSGLPIKREWIFALLFSIFIIRTWVCRNDCVLPSKTLGRSGVILRIVYCVVAFKTKISISKSKIYDKHYEFYFVIPNFIRILKFSSPISFYCRMIWHLLSYSFNKTRLNFRCLIVYHLHRQQHAYDDADCLNDIIHICKTANLE